MVKKKIPLIIYDEIALAEVLDADGLHLRQGGYSPIDARMRLGIQKTLGLSVENLDELHAANALDCIDYVTVPAAYEKQSRHPVATTSRSEHLFVSVAH